MEQLDTLDADQKKQLNELLSAGWKFAPKPEGAKEGWCQHGPLGYMAESPEGHITSDGSLIRVLADIYSSQ